MTNGIELDTLLFPTDFSPAANAALQQAKKLIGTTDPTIILLHVIDPVLVDFAVRHGLTDNREALVERMRDHAEAELESHKLCPCDIDFQTVISEGVPFLEILQKADDFAVDAVVIGKIGWRGSLEKLLFGSTAEKVMRASRRPVISLPYTPEQA